MKTTTSNTLINYSLNPYTGNWTKFEAAHLLRRALFGPSYTDIVLAETDGLLTTIQKLFTVTPNNSEPLTYSDKETVAAFGTPWVNSPYIDSNGELFSARFDSLASWTFQRIFLSGYNIQEKMALFWQNHFGVNADAEPSATYKLHRIYYNNSIGNFKQIVKDVTVNPAMLSFLNGETNEKNAPNENYARELLELFTLGKGAQVATGDYTTYTEYDIAQGAKILSGWRNRMWSDEPGGSISYFQANRHDETSKTLSSRFGSVTITNAGDQEYKNFIDVIFNHPEIGKHLCRRLYRWFVNYEITPEVETNIINPLAQLLITSNFEVEPVLKKLLSSQHFFDIGLRGTIIKNPVEYIFSFLKPTITPPNFDLETTYKMYLNIHWGTDNLGLHYFAPPSVGGWTAYYQAPSFSQLWANSFYIKRRFQYAAWFLLYGGVTVNGNSFKANTLNFLNTLSEPRNPVKVIEDIGYVFAPKGFSIEIQTMLKSILTNGLPDFEWTVQYDEYTQNPNNPSFVNPIVDRIANVMTRLTYLPLFHTI
jgi:uncharacterized protein (DUF1800 family)